MDIAFISSDWARVGPGVAPSPGGAGWVRIHQPAHALEIHGGHRTVIGHGVAAHRTTNRLVPLDWAGKPLMLDPDLVVIQRWMNAEAPQVIRQARAAGQPVLQDVDDWFWGLHPGNQAFYTTDPKRSPDHNREHYKAALQASTAVTVSTDFLARRLRERMGCTTHLIRNCVDPATFSTQPVRNVEDELVIGWCGALLWRSGDLETTRPFLPDWLAKTRSTFVHHGTFPSDPPDAAAAVIGIRPENVGPNREAVPPTVYPDNVAGFDIGIVPLNDVPFNHAKSWIKGLEYAAAGIPFVAFATREYQALDAGLLATTPDEWVAALDELRDPQVRLREQIRGLKAAREHAISARWQQWEQVYARHL